MPVASKLPIVVRLEGVDIDTLLDLIDRAVDDFVAATQEDCLHLCPSGYARCRRRANANAFSEDDIADFHTLAERVRSLLVNAREGSGVTLPEKPSQEEDTDDE
jgi:hypothetical protein